MNCDIADHKNDRWYQRMLKKVAKIMSKCLVIGAVLCYFGKSR